MGLAVLVAAGVLGPVAAQTDRDAGVEQRLRGRETLAFDRYTVHAVDLRGVRQRLEEQARPDINGRHGASRTHVSFVPTVRYAASAGSCRVSFVQIAVRAVVTLPEWSGSSYAGAGDRALWDQFLSDQRDHELEHVLAAEAVAVDWEERVRSLGRGTTCVELDLLVGAVRDEMLADHGSRQTGIDRDYRERAIPDG